jgi:hypothetical protein
VTGVLPFEHEQMYALMKEIVEGTPRSLRDMGVSVPNEFVSVVERAMQRAPGDRFPSVAHMARELLPLAPRRTRGQRVSQQALNRIPMPSVPRHPHDDDDFHRF